MAPDVPAVRRGASLRDAAALSDAGRLRAIVVGVGVGTAVLFVVIGLHYELQLYADGSMFSYAIAVQDAWAFHWHNISGRLFVYLAIEVPSEIVVALTRDAQAGVVFYGFLFFSAPLLGLAATWLADGSKNRIIFSFACASTACACPLVFGFPTEMWVAQALFWPTLAVCHHGRGGFGSAMVFTLMLALVITHEAALVLAGVIVFTLLLRGIKDAAFLRATGALLLALSIWALVKLLLPPDGYDGPVMQRAALHFLDPSILDSYLLVLLFVVLAGYGLAFVAFQRLIPAKAHWLAASVAAVALTAYWLSIDHALHSDQRYPLRTVLLLATAASGLLAALYALETERRLALSVPLLRRLMDVLAGEAAVRAMSSAILVIVLVHAVETVKFSRAWTDYMAAVRALAMGTASDPALGDAHFVSSDRISPDLNRLSWFSTIPYLSVLIAPGAAPTRLVVDPSSNYFWLSCETATANEKADRAIPVESRRLVRLYACLHR